MLNRVVLIGRTTRSPEMRTTQTGKEVANFTLAVDRQFKSPQGEKETDFINVVAWGKTAEICGKYLDKGKLVAVDGRLQIRKYEAKDGTNRTAAEVIAENVRLLSPKSETSRAEPLPFDEPAEVPEGDNLLPVDNQDLPF